MKNQLFLENISTKDDAAKRYFSKSTTDGALYPMKNLFFRKYQHQK